MGNGITAPAIRYPLLSILFWPQATVREVVNRYRGAVYLLVATSGTYGMILDLASHASKKTMHWVALVPISLVAGSVYGISLLYILSALIKWSGSMLDGRATQSQLRSAIAWSTAPQIFLFPFVLLNLFMLGQEFVAMPPPRPVMILHAAASFWGIFLVIRTIGAVQQFNIVKVLTNYALAVVVSMPLFAIPFAFSFVNFPLSSYDESSRAMEPTLLTGESVYVGIWNFEDPQPGDLIVFYRNGRADIKRLIALPGDEVMKKNGELLINNQAIKRERVAGLATDRGRTRYKETLPNGCSYFIFDDRRGGDMPVSKVPAGRYFVRGDNRNDPSDSGASHLPYVPADRLIGKVARIYFSASELIGSESLFQAFDNWRWDRMFSRPH